MTIDMTAGSPAIHIALTGPFRVTRTDGGPGQEPTPVEIRGLKPRQVLTVLALAGGQLVTKEQLAERLWGDTPPASWLATVESYVCVLRRALDPCGGRRTVIATGRGGYTLDLDVVDVDVHSGLDAARRVLRADDAGEADRWVRTLLSSIHGPLLEAEPYAHWAEEARVQLHRTVVEAALHAAELAHAEQDAGTAREHADLALGWDPLCEPALRLAMRARAAQGEHNGALRLYQSVADRLSVEMGCDPDPSTRAVYVDVLQAGDGEALTEPAQARALIDLLRRSLTASVGLRQILSVELESLARDVAAAQAA